MQETADNSNRLKNSLLKDTQEKQENIKIHGIGLDKAGRCTHYHTQLDIAALLCAKCRKYYACYSVMMNWKIIHLPQQHRKKLILFYAETAAGNLHFRNTKKAAALTAMQDLIQNAVYMRIFISVVQIQRIQNSKKFCILFLFVKKSDILIGVRMN